MAEVAARARGTPAARGAGTAIGWAEQGRVPDRMIRAGIRRLNRQRLSEIHAGDSERVARDLDRFVADMCAAPVALVPELANEQHYEVPAAFFAEVLGAEGKYSSCYWGKGVATLDAAERHALQVTCERAGIRDGMAVLDLGCGWGSLSLWIARHFPRCRVLSVSNSASQREHIAARAARLELRNVEVLTRDMNEFDTPRRFDRVVSIEMFEHMRNWAELFRRIERWLQPGGRFFMHVFAHRACAYEFADRGPSDWMSRHFFSGGMMPSDGLATRFQQHLTLLRQWRWDGTHYQRTANAWLENMDRRKAAVMPIMARTYGPQAADQWFMRWRIFFMACAELFGTSAGQEWWVAHYLFGRRRDADHPGSRRD
ncbi:MAG: methyltransferase domain-containing protein [Xanthomonadales bacterium]|nr:methyltransferase domain-containing protein [Xanthomonadales bacterium]NIN58859.1 methyltransferase domain-containing protein [Xanthomonadales bacterium]NIN74127.1 methyltransferase domain-containing protein [Xanthomonadales bacterium]NIO14660.1 methyltransferase domain-containing protein [Xanthomonadales bacterium]NIP11252.1 methyltransferase domain-containing protein [Xanthomonadales bacterium]